MVSLKALKGDIADILIGKSEGEESLLIFQENEEFFEKIFDKDFIFIYSRGHGISLLDLTKIMEEDIILLQEYLDYLNMIEG